MRDARYLRSQAEFCMEMARQMSDRKIADNLKSEAARYQAEAVALETGTHEEWQASETFPKADG